jgi:acetyltransferase-like isoleucine patch superfamily enzyme
MSLKQTIRFSNHPAARAIRTAYQLPDKFSVPAPSVLVRPVLAIYLAGRSSIHFIRRVFIAEPFFKAYCTSYGKRLHTGIFVHWIQGKGKIVLGDDVRFDGKSSFKFAARYTAHPTLEVGNNSGLGHGCSITVGKSITIGNNCRIASGVTMFDSPGHPLDPEVRLTGAPAADEDVKPIRIGNNVWIGSGATIFPGVTIGDNSVVAMGSSVMANVPPDTVVGGSPARSMKSLAKGPNA